MKPEDLPVPDAAYYQLGRYAATWDTDTPNDEAHAVQLIAAPVVARVLRAMAAGNQIAGLSDTASILERHADELQEGE